MTTSTLPAAAHAADLDHPARRALTFPGVVRSEAIKFVTLRSTWWSLGLTLVVMVGLSALLAVSVGGDAAAEGAPSMNAAQVATAGYLFAQLVVAVLGVLAITGEYATGQIRSSLTAVPGRLPVLAAKAIVLAISTFAVGVVGSLAALAVTRPLLDGPPADVADPETWRILLGAGLYLAAIALFALALGALIRHSAGAITAILGIVLLVPMVVNILGSWLAWVSDLAPYLPAAAGERIMATVPAAGAEAVTGLVLLQPWHGYLVLLAYVAVTMTVAAVLLRRRDA